MRCTIALLLLLTFISNVVLQDYTNRTRSCVKCLCHAVSSCYQLTKCALYSISQNYWTRAGSLRSVKDENNGNAGESYAICIKDPECVRETIVNYLSRIGDVDCNCDGKYDCDDMLAIHLGHCTHPMGMPMYEFTKQKYEECAGKSMEDPTTGCTPEEF